jgi:hypothetical protein
MAAESTIPLCHLAPLWKPNGKAAVTQAAGHCRCNKLYDANGVQPVQRCATVW